MKVVIASFTVALIYSYAHQFMWKVGIVPLDTGPWYFIIALLSIVVAIAPTNTRAKYGENQLYDYEKHWKNRKILFLWAIVYGVAALFSYVHSNYTAVDLRAIKTIIIITVMFMIFLVIFKDTNTIRAARTTMIFVVIFSVIMNIVDIMSPGMAAFSLSPGRAAGFYVNPNISGAYLVFGMILTMTILPKRFRFKYCMLIGLGVALTFSRSSLIMWVFSIAAASRLSLFKVGKMVSFAIIGFLVLAFLTLQFIGNYANELGLDKHLTKDQLSRIHYGGKEDLSVQSRTSVFWHAIDLIKEAPVLGYGLGASNDPGPTEVHPHNMFLLVWVEQGIIGLFVYLSILLLLWRSGAELSKLFVLVLIIGALFSHNIMDDVTFFLAVAILLGMTAKKISKEESVTEGTFVKGMQR